MAKKQCVIVDIGSASIVTLIGERGVNNSFKLLGKGEVSYDGFANGKFFDPQNVKNVIAMSISQAEMSSGIKVDEVYVGVPAEFCNIRCEECELQFGRSKKIRYQDFYALMELGAKKHPTYSVINNCVIYFTTDKGKRLINPLGVHTSSLAAKTCYVYAENNFLDFIGGIFNDIGISNVHYISSTLAEMLYLMSPSMRDKYAILVDIGYITTSVAVGQGDGLLFLNSFSLGGGHITGDLAQILKMPFTQAESLKRKVVLNWQASESDTYEVMGKDFITTYSAKAANEIVEARLEIIAKYINKCLERCKYELPEYLPVLLTGGGINYIKGARDFMSRKLGRKVQLVSPPVGEGNKPDFSAEIAMLDVAIRHAEDGLNILY